MPLYATTAITGPNGEQVDRDMKIPAGWDLASEFVTEGIAAGWLVNRDDPDEVSPLPATPPVVEADVIDVTADGRRHNRGHRDDGKEV